MTKGEKAEVFLQDKQLLKEKFNNSLCKNFWKVFFTHKKKLKSTDLRAFYDNIDLCNLYNLLTSSNCKVLS